MSADMEMGKKNPAQVIMGGIDPILSDLYDRSGFIPRNGDDAASRTSVVKRNPAGAGYVILILKIFLVA